MEKQTEAGVGKFVQRHVSQLKVLSRLLEHELDTVKGQDLTIDREMAESMLDTLEIFIEDVTGSTKKERRAAAPEKPSVTRLN